jgi:4-hydroxy-tetrahydrodipicolinate synthase
MTQQLRGIYSIIQTPFDAAGNLLWADMERESDWTIRAGSHGVVWPVMASEFTVLSYRERVEGFRLIADTVAGRVPFVAGVADTSQAGATDLALEAARAGADALIALPPWSTKLASEALVEAYYRALAEAADLPIVVQNCDPPFGSGLSARFVVELCRRIPQVRYLKEEKSPQGHSLSEVIALSGEEVHGVFSGASCHWIISEHARGCCGNMPACVLPDVDARIWDLLESGQGERARELHDAKMVLERALAAMPTRRARKEVLVRRGVLSQPYGRNLGPERLDEIDMAELERGMAAVAPYLTL